MTVRPIFWKALAATVVFAAVVASSGCAGLEHRRIAAENAALERKMGIPTYGVSNRNHPLWDAAHGALWWYGSEAAKEELDKLIRD